jgi:5-methylcytosine-specific restriction enzyme A
MSDKINELRDYFRKNPNIPRNEISDRFGGNRQKGISISKDYPVIFIFTNEEGEKNGYEDWWNKEDGYFH